MHMSFFDRYEESCREHGIAPMSQEAADRLGVTKSAISVMAKKGTTPRGDTVRNAALMLDVSADYLLEIDGRELPEMEKQDTTAQEKRLLEYYRRLGDKGKKLLSNMAEELGDISRKEDDE